MLVAVAGGDQTALGLLYDRFANQALGLAMRIVRDRGVAEEVVQDAFLAAWRRAESYQAGRGDVRGWLLSIVHHRAIDRLRGATMTARRAEVEDMLAIDVADAADVWQEVARGLEQVEIATAMRSLPAAQRAAIELAFFGGMTHAEVAARTGEPLGTVKGRVRLGLLKLRGLLDASLGADDEAAACVWFGAWSRLRDPSRVAALRRTGLMDTPGEEAFDRLARLACRTLDASGALVTLVDADRQYFKSCVGLPEPWATWRTMPFSTSFCAHMVDSGEPLVVEDARPHPVFRHNVAVRELGVVSYAGVPLTTPRGHVLGSFCVVDGRPRAWAPAELDQLSDLAGAVMTEIELRCLVRELEEHAAAAERARERTWRLIEAIDGALVGLDDAWRFSYVNGPAARLLERAPADLLGRRADEVFPGAFDAASRRACELALGSDSTAAFSMALPSVGWLDVRAFGGPGGVALYLRDEQPAGAANVMECTTVA